MKLVGVLHAEAILANGPSRRACARRTCPPAGFMRFRAVVAALVPVLLQGPLHAWPVDPVSAARIGRFKLAELAPDGRWDLTGTFEAVPAAAGGTLAYVFDLHPRGFVIVSGDNSLPPVIAYSLENALDAPGDHPNPLRALLRSDLENRLANGHKIPRAWRETNREAWDACLREDAQTDTQRDFRQWPPQGTTSTGGWLATRWTQDPPYNGFCPVDPTTGRRSLAGCPAVAMAQILHYHTSLNGTRFSDADDYFHNYAGQYMIDDDHELHGFPSFPELNVNLDTLTAHYEYGGPITNTDKAAVVFACGVAAHQVYSSQGSGTFGVDQAYQAYLRFAHDEVELLGEATPLLYPRLAVNMIDGLPAHLAVVTPQWNAGHNLVVDGYNTTGYFHMNFGWGGFADAWYDLPEELPYDLTVIEGVIVDIGSVSVYPDGDDVPEAATVLELEVEGLSQTIHREGDADWFRFYSEGGADLRMFADKIPGCELDPVFWLYGPHAADGSDVDPGSFVASDDNSHGDLQPEIGFTAVESGFYFLRVACADPPAGGADVGAYLLTIDVTGGLVPPESLYARVTGHDVHLSWNPPQNACRDLIGYHVYRDGERLNAQTIPAPEYHDLELADGAYVYVVTAMYQGGESGPSGQVAVEVPATGTDTPPEAPATSILSGAYPNPFRSAAMIHYTLAREADVTVTVHGLAGQRIRTLAHGTLGAGSHTVVWDGTDAQGRPVAAGLYFCRMSTDGLSLHKPLVLLR